MTLVSRVSLGAVAMAAALLAAGWLQGANAQTSSAVGKVDAQQGSAVVVRGAETFSLAPEAPLFLNDRLFTRANSTLIVTVNNCTKTLTGNQTMIVNDEFCAAAPIALGAGAESTTQIAGIGATPAILGALALTGGTAAAVSGGNSSSP